MPKFDIDFDDYSKFASDGAFYVHNHTGDFFELNYILLGIGGEAGEVIDAWKKIVRESNPEDPDHIRYPLTTVNHKHSITILYELGDVMWYVAQASRALGISIDDILLVNTFKLYMRHNTGKGSWGWPYKMTIQDAAARVKQVEDLVRSRPAISEQTNESDE